MNLVPDVFIALAKGIYIWYQQGYQPARLKDNILSLFQSFKTAYDAKNVKDLSRIISDSYSGTMAGDKTSLLKYFQAVFESIPTWANLNLSINVYQIIEDTPESFKAIIDFRAQLAVMVISFWDYGSGRIYIEIQPEPPYGIYKITKIDIIGD